MFIANKSSTNRRMCQPVMLPFLRVNLFNENITRGMWNKIYSMAAL